MADADGNRYGPYDIEVAGSEAEAFTEAAWYLMNRDSGVLSGGALTFTALTAHLAPVELRAHGSFLAREDEWIDASPATTGAAPRRDLLVARRQLTAGEGAGAVPGKTFLTVLRGTPAATPADPAHDPENDEPLWSWQVPGGGGTVVTDIRDLRGRPEAGTWITDYKSPTTSVLEQVVGSGDYYSPTNGGGPYKVFVPAGRTLEVAWHVPVIDLPAGMGVIANIFFDGVASEDADYFSNSGAASVGMPCRLRARYTGADAVVSFGVRVLRQGPGNNPSLRGATVGYITLAHRIV